MLSKISSLLGGGGVFSVLHQPATSVVFLALQGQAKALGQGVHRLDALIANPTAQIKGQQAIDLLLTTTAGNAAKALRAFEGEQAAHEAGGAPLPLVGDAFTELKTDLQRLGLPDSDPDKMDMTAFLKKHVHR